MVGRDGGLKRAVDPPLPPVPAPLVWGERRRCSSAGLPIVQAVGRVLGSEPGIDPESVLRRGMAIEETRSGVRH